MSIQTFRLPEPRTELTISLLLGVAFAIFLFVMIAFAQMLGDVKLAETELDESVIALEAPEVEEVLEEEPPPPPPPPKDLDEPPPQLSLDQLDIALNPGTGGSLAGDFAMVNLGAAQQALASEAFLDFSALDQVPRPIGVTGFNFPARLLKDKVSGKIVLLLKLDENGKVITAEVDSSTLPNFNDFVLGEVKRWKFTPPTQDGRAVKAQARLPIPITIR